MYLEHFQLKSQPFSEHAAVSALWQDQRMDEGLARLEYLINAASFGLVTGPSGVGKSALLKRFLHGSAHSNIARPSTATSPTCRPPACSKLVVTQLGETPRRGKERTLRTDPGTGRDGPRAPCCWSSTKRTCWTATP